MSGFFPLDHLDESNELMDDLLERNAEKCDEQLQGRMYLRYCQATLTSSSSSHAFVKTVLLSKERRRCAFRNTKSTRYRCLTSVTKLDTLMCSKCT
ncbi:hypothetical protein KIN20_000940 [Parelaphostrongylus tenuis]|uniref:Uncharacterized protein n=1 Tax=Parelaphostrongylus tenuis TaxID=148309 RepID=A0AAD5MC28_PARTN|nr:hypothetical protein KIN20_000940 [Parelaphostrongylus tenuis]